MLIAKLTNNEIEIVGEHTQLFPNTSFPTGNLDVFLQQNNCLRVSLSKPFNPTSEKLLPVPAYLENGEVYTVAVFPLTEEEISARIKSSWVDIRSIRNKKLTESDWTQVDDAPLTNLEKASWAAYRQALRDITTQASPESVEWPTPPNEVTHES